MRGLRIGVASLAAAIVLAAGPAAAGTVALTGGTVHTLGPDGTLERGTVLIRDGRIAAVGREVALPAGARRIDLTGKVLTPGLMDSMTRLGLVEIGAVDATRDFAVDDDGLTAAFDVVDALNPRSTLIPVSRIEGLTRAVVAPAAGAGLLAGRGAVIHLGHGDLVLSSPAALFAVLGEAGSRRSGGSRGAAMLRLREALADTRDFMAHREDWLEGDRFTYALGRLDLEALEPVVRGQLPLVIGVERASDIMAALRLAADEKVRLVLAGASEGWLVAAEIAAAGVPVLLDPLSNRPARFETLAATLENAARLHAAGVPVAFMSGEAHNARNLRQAAGNAVAHGLPWEAGLAGLTRTPAAIWGLAGSSGTLEPGRDADVVIWDGDPLEVTTSAERVYIRGEEMPMDSRQIRLRERYRSLDGDWPPAYTRP